MFLFIYLCFHCNHFSFCQQQLDHSLPPTENKFFFKIKAVNDEIDSPHTFQSKETNEYLHCGEDGSIFMSQVTRFEENGAPSDRKTWFRKILLKGICQCSELRRGKNRYDQQNRSDTQGRTRRFSVEEAK